MQRVKLFEAAHKGLRSALCQFSSQIGKTDFNNTEQVSILHVLGKEVFMMLSTHANDENSIILAELEAKVPGSSKHDMDDHEKLEADQSAMETLLDEIREIQNKGEDAAGFGAELYMKFLKFHGEYLLHTYEEETETQRLLWDNFTDEEIHAMRGRIIARFTPGAFEIWQKYIMPSITPGDRTMLFKGMKMQSPEGFQKLMAMAKKYLSPEELGSLEKSLE
jgi:hypothetical protein